MNSKLKGPIFITLSALFFGSYGIWANIIGSNLGAFFQFGLRALIIMPILIPIGIYSKGYKKVKKEDIKWFLIIGLSGALTQSPYFFAFNKLNIGTSTLFFYTSLTFIGYIIGILFFNEKLTIIKFISLVLALFGLALIFKLSLNTNLIFPAFCAILAGSMGGIEVVFTKKISNNYSAIQITTYTFLTILIVNIFISIFLHEKNYLNVNSVLGEIAWTLATVFAFYFVILGYKYTTAILGSILGLSEILFGILFGSIIFKQVLPTYTIVGSIVIIFAIALPYIKMPRKSYT